MMPLVSILIPAYNAERWVRDAIRSALGQSWASKEVIVVNDGSSDNTLAILRQFKTPLLKVVTQENKGASSARNAALSHAQGEYIQWLDADDILHLHKISEQLKNRPECLNPRFLLSSACGAFYARYQMAKFSPDMLWQNLDPVTWLTTKFTNNLSMLPHAWLVNRELTERAGPWNEELSLDDDGEYFSRLVSLSEKVIFAPGARSYYRRGNGNSLSHDKSDKALRSLLSSIKLCCGYLRSLEDTGRTRKACLKYIEHHAPYFIHCKPDLLSEVERLAKELGGRLEPKTSKKFQTVRNILGPETALKLKLLLWRLEVSGCRKWELARYLLSASSRGSEIGIE